MRQQKSKLLSENLSLFPQDLNSNTEFWLEWTEDEIKKLAKAMLVQALDEIRDLRRSKKMRKEAWEWLFSDENFTFSAANCAAYNGMNIRELRRMLKRIIPTVH